MGLLKQDSDCKQLENNPFVGLALHCVTSLIIGLHLGYRKFLGRAYYFLTVIFLPTLLHAIYKMALQYRHYFSLGKESSEWGPLKTLFVFEACATVVAGAWYG